MPRSFTATLRSTARRPLTLSAALAVAALTTFCARPVAAQFELKDTAYYVTGDYTLSADVTGFDVLVGKDPTTLNTLPGPITLTVAEGAVVTTGPGVPGPDFTSYRALSVFDGHRVNITGGTASLVEAYGGSRVRVSGGTISDFINTYDASTVDVSGGDIEFVYAYDNSTANITGGNVRLAYAEGNGTLNISDVTVAKVFGFEGTPNINVTNSTVDDFGAFYANTLNITNSIITSDFGVDEANILNITNSSVTTYLYAGEVGTVNIAGSTLESVGVYEGDVNLSGGTTMGELSLSNSGTVNVDGAVIDSFYGYEGTTLNVNDGAVTIIDSSGIVNVRAGATVDESLVYSAGMANITGGSVGTAVGEDGSVTNISGGVVADATASGGVTFGDELEASIFNISGGSVTNMTARLISQVNVTGGSITNAIGYDQSVFNIYDGFIAEILAYDESVFNIYGGNIGGNTITQLSDAAMINFFGLDIAYTGAEAGVSNGLSGIYYNVAWTRNDNTVVNTRYFDVNGVISDGTPQGIALNPVVVPEAGSLALLLPGFVLGMVIARRKQ